MKVIVERFNCSNNPIRNLKGLPNRITHLFVAQKCIYLKSIEDLVNYDVNGNFDFEDTPLKSLKGLPERITGYLDISKTYISNLNYLPKAIGDTLYMYQMANLKVTKQEVKNICSCDDIWIA